MRNKEDIIGAVAHSGWILQQASMDDQADKSIVLAAVSQNGWVLQYASKQLQADKEVVLAADRCPQDAEGARSRAHDDS